MDYVLPNKKHSIPWIPSEWWHVHPKKSWAGSRKLRGQELGPSILSNRPHGREAVKQGAVKIGRPSDVWSLGIILCDRQRLVYGWMGWWEARMLTPRRNMTLRQLEVRLLVVANPWRRSSPFWRKRDIQPLMSHANHYCRDCVWHARLPNKHPTQFLHLLVFCLAECVKYFPARFSGKITTSNPGLLIMSGIRWSTCVHHSLT